MVILFIKSTNNFVYLLNDLLSLVKAYIFLKIYFHLFCIKIGGHFQTQYTSVSYLYSASYCFTASGKVLAVDKF